LNQEYLIIVAGGTGSRMNNTQPKQFIEVGGVPMIIRTLHCFLKYNPKIRVVISVHKDYMNHLASLIAKSGLNSASIQLTQGGATRFHSVKNGLRLLQGNNGVVGIHDAARPFVSLQTIENCFKTAASEGNAIPCIDVNESLRQVSGAGNTAVSRGDFRIVQTPQCFLIAEIQNAFEQEYQPAFTDDATVLESTGKKINLVKGNIENIKITSNHDLQIAKALLNNEQR
jgi:2-C-methyl-D-erythritol 4-phosphate cytidylyltransferase